MLTDSRWASVPGLRHAFLDGGECAGEWSAVLARIGLHLPLVVPRQVHGTTVAVAADGVRPEADALLTARPGLVVGVVTADCVPVLLVDRRRRAAAAVHAGWRGAAAGILEATVAEMRRVFATDAADLQASIGPAVGGCCYEVGPEVAAAFRARSGSTTDAAWSVGTGRPRLDLRSAARLLLAAAGVTDVALHGPCTVCGAGYHSYRRDGARTGRQLSLVGWE